VFSFSLTVEKKSVSLSAESQFIVFDVENDLLIDRITLDVIQSERRNERTNDTSFTR
jgi:hypothetical protein